MQPIQQPNQQPIQQPNQQPIQRESGTHAQFQQPQSGGYLHQAHQQPQFGGHLHQGHSQQPQQSPTGEQLYGAGSGGQFQQPSPSGQFQQPKGGRLENEHQGTVRQGQVPEGGATTPGTGAAGYSQFGWTQQSVQADPRMKGQPPLTSGPEQSYGAQYGLQQGSVQPAGQEQMTGVSGQLATGEPTVQAPFAEEQPVAQVPTSQQPAGQGWTPQQQVPQRSMGTAQTTLQPHSQGSFQQPVAGQTALATIPGTGISRTAPPMSGAVGEGWSMTAAQPGSISGFPGYQGQQSGVGSGLAATAGPAVQYVPVAVPQGATPALGQVGAVPTGGLQGGQTGGHLQGAEPVFGQQTISGAGYGTGQQRQR